MPTKRRRFMVNLPPELEAAVIARAKELNRPIANYLEWLVSQDIHEMNLQEEQAKYEADSAANADLAKPKGEKIREEFGKKKFQGIYTEYRAEQKGAPIAPPAPKLSAPGSSSTSKHR